MGLYYIQNVDGEQNKIFLHNEMDFFRSGNEPLEIVYEGAEDDVCVYEELFNMACVLNISLVVQYDTEKGIILH